MPSIYCQGHPQDVNCYFNPNWNGSIFSGGGGLPPSGGYPPENNPIGNTGGSSGNSGTLPNWTINQGGATGQQGTYSQTLAAILSGLAILHNQPYVPTTVQPVQPQPIIYSQPASTGSYGEPHQNAFGSIQQVIQQHPMATLAAVVVIGALLLKPPVRRNGLRRNRRGR